LANKDKPKLNTGDCLVHKELGHIVHITYVIKRENYKRDWYCFNSLDQWETNSTTFYTGGCDYETLIKTWKYCKTSTILYGKSESLKNLGSKT